MKRIGSLLFGFVLLFNACSTDFKVGAPYKEISVVYFLLSASDSANYVKITKGFYDENLNNLLIAQNADSLYSSNLEVKLEELLNGNVTNTYTLPRVNLVSEGYVKNPGVFVDSPNYAFKFKGYVNARRLYRLTVKNLSTGKIITGTTDVIDTMPNVFSIINPFTSFDKLNFADPIKSYPFTWNGPPNAVFFDVVVRFWYEEKNTNTLQTIYKYKDLTVLKNVSATGGSVTAAMNNLDFYKALNSELGNTPTFISRYVDTPDLLILAGGQQLKTYIDVNAAQSGITFDQIKPNYTNLVGENVFGIMSCRSTRFLRQIDYNDATYDSIINGQYTKNLNIVGKSSR